MTRLDRARVGWRPPDRRVARLGVALACLLALALGTGVSRAARTPADELAAFKAWLDRERPGYGCDEGPARFRNPTVEAAYPGRRFYYVFTHTRGIPPPFRNPVTMVAQVDDSGAVHPIQYSSLDGYRSGLIRVSSSRDTRRAAAAVLILAMGDPGERRWKFREEAITARKKRKAWICTYQHGSAIYTSQVDFDRRGELTAIRVGAPPVP